MTLSRTLAEKLLALEPLTCRADMIGRALTLRSNDAEVTPAMRDALLAKCAACEYVELDVDVLAYEQDAGVRNRNNVRFRDGALMQLGRSGKDKPFLRDHDQYDVNSRAGTILASSTDKRDEGSYSIKMTVRLTAPWAVALALRGLLSTVSIGWQPTGPIMCSACDAPRFTKCYHFPGDTLKETTDSDGNTIRVRDRAGSIVVEWIFTAAELVECSVVSVPAVPGAQIEGIRASLAATNPAFSAGMALDDHQHPTEIEMNKLAALAAILSLPATATEDNVLAATEALKKDRDAKVAELAIKTSELTIANAELGVLSVDKAKTDEDKFIDGAIASGRITLGADKEWRVLFQVAPDRARTLMSGKAENSATPLGAGRQTPATDITPKTDLAPTTDTKAALAASGADAGMTLKFADAFGVKKPLESVGKVLGVKGA